ncbi:hypothetical protein CBM2629_A170175 [Cupriavidus taiwanensis]|nr:hypothetical protein CBM2629_A170175 [Cupriavidus taiwanensis]
MSTAMCRRISGAEAAMKGFVDHGTAARVVFEWGALAQLPAELDRLGAKRALILASPDQRDLADRIASALGERAAGLHANAVMHIEVAAAARDAAAALAPQAACPLTTRSPRPRLTRRRIASRRSRETPRSRRASPRSRLPDTRLATFPMSSNKTGCGLARAQAAVRRCRADPHGDCGGPYRLPRPRPSAA